MDTAPSASPAAAANYPGEPVVVLDRHSIVTMHADGTGIRDSALAIRIQSDGSVRQFGVVQLPFASAAEHAEFLYVRVRHPDGKTTETPVSGALEQPAEVTREAPFYSDLKVLQLPVKDLGVGDTLEWRGRVTRTVPEAPGQFWGQDTFLNTGISLAETLELHIPASSHITLWTNPDIAKPGDTTSGAERVITWSSHHLVPSTGPEADAQKKILLTPEQDLANRKGALPSLAWTTFPDWAAVGAWYRGLETDRMKPDPAIVARVAQLTAGKSNDLAKAQAVYTYVATQIRYVGISFGIGRYQPHTAAEVLANQYGDCKDKHTLLAAMLGQLGLQADAVLVGAGVRFNDGAPSPGSFNHLITQLHLGGKVVWLDTTAEVAPWGTLVPAIRDQSVLVIPQATPATVQITEAMPPYDSFTKAVTTETLDKDLTSDARMSLTFHDDDELGLRGALRQITPAQYPEFVQRLMAAMGYGGTTSEPEISNPNDLSQPLTLSFRYKRVKDADWGENRVTTPFWAMILPSVTEKEPPTSSIELGTPRTETSNVEVKLPAGWDVELPEAIHAKADFATVDTTFHLKAGTVTAERTLTILQPRVSAGRWREYNKWYETGQINSYPFLQLKNASLKAATLPSNQTSTSADSSSDGPREQVSKAEAALQAMNIAEATRLLDQVKAEHPKQPFLWSEYAFSAYLQGKMSEATENVNKEMALHPDEVQLNGLLAAIKQAQGENDAAVAALYRWALATPDNPEAITTLIQALQRAKRPEEACTVGAGALTRLANTNADLTRFRLTLADAQRSAGHKAEAAATVQPLAKTVTDIFQKNSVAYILADAKVDLPNDESEARDVIAQLNDETKSWTLDEAPRVLFSRTSLLVASWDTLGWTLFQEGHLSEARTFVAAAWRNMPNPEVTSHLHTIDSALHRPTSEETGSEQSRRTFALGPAQGRHGTAELRILLGDGKVLRAEPVASPDPAHADAHGNAAPTLSDPVSLVMAADVHSYFPGTGEARLVRRGFVSCSTTGCQLVLIPM